MEVTEYRIVVVSGSRKPVEKMTRLVNDLIKQGWQPLGGLSGKVNLYQVMVKVRPKA